MTHAEKWAKHAELSAKADKQLNEWRVTCRQINDLLMIRTTDNPHSRKRRKPVVALHSDRPAYEIKP